MVGHDHIAVDYYSVSVLSDGEGFEEDGVDGGGGVGCEEESSLEAAVADEVDALFGLESQSSSHWVPSLLVGQARVLAWRVIDGS